MTESYELLLDGALKRDPRAQRALFDRLSPRMLAVCYRYAKDRDDAQDMLQEGFVKVFERIDQFDRKGAFEGWVRRIMVNTAIDQLRRQKNWREKQELDHVTDEAPPDALDALSVEEIYRAIQALPPGYKAVFNLFAIEGYSHAEIGAQLGIEESTSRSQYVRARSILMKRIRVDSMEKNTYRDAI